VDGRDVGVALVTGGGAGIGAAVCARLAERGWTVVAADVDETAAEKVAAGLGGPASALAVDVSDAERNRAMVAGAVARHGRLDLVVLNAGIASDQPPDMPLDLDRYRRANAVNVDGVVFGIDAAAPELARHGGGSIVVTASLAGIGPQDANPVYALGKAAVVGYVRAISVPLTRTGVRVNAMCPGFADTAILGITRRLLRKQGFPLLTAEQVADGIVTVHERAGTGEVWTVVPGRPVERFEFAPVPSALNGDGTEARMKPFLSKA
jgi:NAD(P)-dependent dehydrogenase (short-subunit alcohol dehydrogenase family)